MRAVSSIDDGGEPGGGGDSGKHSGNEEGEEEKGKERDRRPRQTFGEWMQFHFGTNPHAASICRGGGTAKANGGGESNNNGTANGHDGDCCEHFATDLPGLTCRDEPFLYILIGSICWMLSCTYDHLINYPADVVLPYIRGLNLRRLGLFRGGQVVRVDPSIKSLERALLHGVNELRCGVRVTGVDGDRVIDGVKYDAVICATEAKAVPKVVKGCSDAFGKVRYHRSTVYLHTDERAMPPRREDWRCWNVEQKPGRDGPQLTFWLNEFFPDAQFDTDVFQTWAPLRDIEPNKMLQRSDFERVVHAGNTADLVKRIRDEQGKRGIYYAGSYCVYGMGLLEQALISGMDAGDMVLKDLFQED
uniref:Amine oxidase domain-containing protein n=1 Tax=Odontella aurita TaxID=265563 RepID=A0A7S4MVK0_9STRA